MEVRSYLDMQRARHHIAHDEIHHTGLPRAAATEDSPVPAEETADGHDLRPPNPATAAGLGGLIAGYPEIAK
jgi:hypothetical protein